MSSRYKPQVGKLESLEEVNLKLKEIGLLEREIEQLDGDAQKEITEIKAKAARKGAPLRARIIEASAQISAFAQYNKVEMFKDKKSIELSFGIFGFRKSTAIRVKKTTVELLRKLKLGRFIRVKEEPDKEALAELDDETLAQVDAVRKVKDEFFCQANREEVNKDLLAAGM